MQKPTKRVLSLVLSFLLLVSIVPTTVFAAVNYNHDSSQTAGDYYYINSSKKAVKNCTYGISEAKANGLMPAGKYQSGKYQFGADGKMILD